MTPNTDPSAPDPTRAFYDRISYVYDLIADASEHAARDAGLEALGVSPGERVLEIGCGTGRAMVSLARAAGDHGVVCGIDLSHGMIDVSRQRLRDEPLARHVHLQVADARHLPFRSRQFDAAFLSFTLELFEARGRADLLTELRRVLRERGRLGVVSMVETTHAGTANDIYTWMHRHFPHIVDCRPINLVSVLTEAGFTLERHDTTSIWGLPVAAGVARAN